MTWIIGILIVGVLLFIALGIGECFYGFRIFNFFLRVLGFLSGGLLMWHLGSLISPSAGLLAAIVGAIVGVLIAVPLHCVGVFLMGASMGASLSGAVLVALGMADAWLLMIPFAIVAGILAVWLRKPVIIISTAIVGAGMLQLIGVVVLGMFRAGIGARPEVNAVLADASNIISLIIWLVLAIAGSIFQFRKTSDLSDTRRRKPENYRQNTVLG